jgi:hypothetical protein
MLIDKIYDFLIVHFVEPLSKLNNFPNIIQGIGLALLTILIPLAIAVLADIYQKRKDKEKEFVYLDLHVILDNVFNIKLLILSVFLIFLPMFFWDILIDSYRLIAIILTSIGIILVTVIIVKVYRWIKGSIFDFRFSYLKKVKKHNDLGIVWKSIWEVTKINIQDEKEFCKIFFSKIDHLQESPKSNLKITSKLLNDFYDSISKRSIYLLLEPSITFNKILEWHFKIWQNEYIYIKKYLESKDKSKSSFNYSEILRVLDSILMNIEERSFKKLEAFSFFIYFKKHAEKYKDKLVDNGNKHYYISYLFDLFYRVFFKNVEKINFSEKLFIWDQCFPKEWKISKTNLTDKENKFFSNLSLRCFLNWAQQRISQAKEEKDFVLGEVSSNLFPEVEPNLWAKFLIFIFSSSKDRVKLAIEKPWNFGFIDRVKIYPGEIGNEEMYKKMSEDTEKEKQKTYELACYIFKEFSKENITKYIKEIKNLEYPKESNEENKKIELLDIFNELLEYLNK